MKTPDEIKKGLECCSKGWEVCSENCTYEESHGSAPKCMIALKEDALAYIQQLEAEKAELVQKLQQLERERDAAVRDCACFPCYTCNELANRDNCCLCKCESGTSKRSHHEWRGLCEENGGNEGRC